MWRITPIHRALAGTLAAALVATSLPPELFAQSPLHWSNAPTASPFDLPSLDLNRLSIPPALGHLVDVWQPEGQAQGVVFHLQDIHAHTQAQFQLGRLIGELQQAAGIKLVAVEGTAGRCETELYSSLPDPPSTDTVARLFVREGLFSGAEYYAITHPDRVTLWGVEDDAAFREHLRVSQQGSRQSALFADILSRLQKALEERIDTLWPAQMQRLHGLRRRYETDLATPSLTAYADALLKQLELLKGKAEEYPNLLRFSDTQYALARLRPAQIDREHRQLLRALQKQLPTLQRRKLAQLNGYFERRELAHATYYAALLTLAGAAGKRYTTLGRYAQALKRQAAIKPAVLQQELEALYARVQDARLTDERARVLAQVLEQITVLLALVQTRLSPLEYQRYQTLAGTLRAEQLWGAVQRVDSTGWPVTAGELTQVFEGLSPYQRFYELARQRDEALVRNTVAQMQTQEKPAAILVAGGFHTPGLAAQLQAQGIAYAVIAPQVTEAFDAELYEKTVRDEIPSLEELAAKLAQQTLKGGAAFASAAEVSVAVQQGGITRWLSKRSGLWSHFVQLKELKVAVDRQFTWLQNWFLTHPQLAEQLGWTLAVEGETTTLQMGNAIVTLPSVQTSTYTEAGRYAAVDPFMLDLLRHSLSQEPMTIMEIGLGRDGAPTFEDLLKRVRSDRDPRINNAQVVGIDNQPEVLAAAQQRLGAPSGVQLLLGDFKTPAKKYAGKIVDLLLVRNVLGHYDQFPAVERKRMVEALVPSLREGGLLVLGSDRVFVVYQRQGRALQARWVLLFNGLVTSATLAQPDLLEQWADGHVLETPEAWAPIQARLEAHAKALEKAQLSAAERHAELIRRLAADGYAAEYVGGQYLGVQLPPLQDEAQKTERLLPRQRLMDRPVMRGLLLLFGIGISAAILLGMWASVVQAAPEHFVQALGMSSASVADRLASLWPPGGVLVILATLLGVLHISAPEETAATFQHHNRLPREAYVLPPERFGGDGVNLLDVIEQTIQGELNLNAPPLLSLIGSLTYGVDTAGQMNWDLIEDIDVRVHLPENYGWIFKLNEARLGASIQEALAKRGVTNNPPFNLRVVGEEDLFLSGTLLEMGRLPVYAPHHIFFGDVEALNRRLAQENPEAITDMLVKVYRLMQQVDSLTKTPPEGESAEQHKTRQLKRMKRLAELAYLRGDRARHQQLLTVYRRFQERFNAPEAESISKAHGDALLVYDGVSEERLRDDIRATLQVAAQPPTSSQAALGPALTIPDAQARLRALQQQGNSVRMMSPGGIASRPVTVEVLQAVTTGKATLHLQPDGRLLLRLAPGMSGGQGTIAAETPLAIGARLVNTDDPEGVFWRITAVTVKDGELAYVLVNETTGQKLPRKHSDLITERWAGAASRVFAAPSALGDTPIPDWFPNYTEQALATLHDAFEAINARFGAPDKPRIILAAIHSRGSIARGYAMPYSDVDRLVVLHDLSTEEAQQAQAMLRQMLEDSRIRLDTPREGDILDTVWIDMEALESLLSKSRADALTLAEHRLVFAAQLAVSSSPNAAPSLLGLKRIYDRLTEHPLSDSLARLTFTAPQAEEIAPAGKAAVRERLFKDWSELLPAIQQAIWTIHMAAMTQDISANSNPETTVRVAITEEVLQALQAHGDIEIAEISAHALDAAAPAGFRRFRAKWCDRFFLVPQPNESGALAQIAQRVEIPAKDKLAKLVPRAAIPQQMAVARHVNPDSRAITGLYLGSGSDVVTFLLSTNVANGVLVDQKPFKGQHDRLSEEDAQYYDARKRGQGFADAQLLDTLMKRGYGLEALIVHELETIGATQIRVQSLDDRTHRVTFDWAYPGEDARPRSLTVLQNTGSLQEQLAALAQQPPLDLQPLLQRGIDAVVVKQPALDRLLPLCVPLLAPRAWAVLPYHADRPEGLAIDATQLQDAAITHRAEIPQAAWGAEHSVGVYALQRAHPAPFQAALKDGSAFKGPISRQGLTAAAAIQAAITTDPATLRLEQDGLSWQIDAQLATQLGADAVGALLQAALDRLKPEERTALQGKTLTLALLDTSPNLFENHLADGLIGINRALFELEPASRDVALKVGLRHELRHEAAGPEADHAALEAVFTADDVAWTMALLADHAARALYWTALAELTEQTGYTEMLFQAVRAEYAPGLADPTLLTQEDWIALTTRVERLLDGRIVARRYQLADGRAVWVTAPDARGARRIKVDGVVYRLAPESALAVPVATRPGVTLPPALPVRWQDTERFEVQIGATRLQVHPAAGVPLQLKVGSASQKGQLLWSLRVEARYPHGAGQRRTDILQGKWKPRSQEGPVFVIEKMYLDEVRTESSAEDLTSMGLLSSVRECLAAETPEPLTLVVQNLVNLETHKALEDRLAYLLTMPAWQYLEPLFSDQNRRSNWWVPAARALEPEAYAAFKRDMEAALRTTPVGRALSNAGFPEQTISDHVSVLVNIHARRASILPAPDSSVPAETPARGPQDGQAVPDGAVWPIAPGPGEHLVDRSADETVRTQIAQWLKQQGGALEAADRVLQEQTSGEWRIARLVGLDGTVPRRVYTLDATGRLLEALEYERTISAGLLRARARRLTEPHEFLEIERRSYGGTFETYVHRADKAGVVARLPVASFTLDERKSQTTGALHIAFIDRRPGAADQIPPIEDTYNVLMALARDQGYGVYIHNIINPRMVSLQRRFSAGTEWRVVLQTGDPQHDTQVPPVSALVDPSTGQREVWVENRSGRLLGRWRVRRDASGQVTIDGQGRVELFDGDTRLELMITTDNRLVLRRPGSEWAYGDALLYAYVPVDSPHPTWPFLQHYGVVDPQFGARHYEIRRLDAPNLVGTDVVVDQNPGGDPPWQVQPEQVVDAMGAQVSVKVNARGFVRVEDQQHTVFYSPPLELRGQPKPELISPQVLQPRPDATHPSLLRDERGSHQPGAPTPGPGLEVLSTGSLLLISAAAIGSALGFWWGVGVALISGSLWLAISMIARSAAREEAQRNASLAHPAQGLPSSARMLPSISFLEEVRGSSGESIVTSIRLLTHHVVNWLGWRLRLQTRTVPETTDGRRHTAHRQGYLHNPFPAIYYHVEIVGDKTVEEVYGAYFRRIQALAEEYGIQRVLRLHREIDMERQTIVLNQIEKDPQLPVRFYEDEAALLARHFPGYTVINHVVHGPGAAIGFSRFYDDVRLANLSTLDKETKHRFYEGRLTLTAILEETNRLHKLGVLRDTPYAYGINSLSLRGQVPAAKGALEKSPAPDDVVGQATAELHVGNSHQGDRVAITTDGTRNSAVLAQGAENVERYYTRRGEIKPVTVRVLPDLAFDLRVPTPHLEELQTAGWDEARIGQLLAQGVTQHLARSDGLVTRAQLDALAREPLFFAIADVSPNLWNDHLANRRIFMSRALLEFKQQGEVEALVADAHFAAGITHEMVHEATGIGDESDFEARLAVIDAAILHSQVFMMEPLEGRTTPALSPVRCQQVVRALLAAVPVFSGEELSARRIGALLSAEEQTAIQNVAWAFDQQQARSAMAAGVDAQPEARSRLEYIGLDMAHKAFVNPDDQPLTALYGGAGGDLLHLIYATNATELNLVDRIPLSFTELQKQLSRWQQGMLEVDRTPLSFSELDKRLSRWQQGMPQKEQGRNEAKRLMGYSTISQVGDAAQATRQLLEDLIAMGVRPEEVHLRPHPDDPAIPQLQFWWTYPGSARRQQYTVTLIAAAMQDFDDPARLPPVLNDLLMRGIDIYYQRGGYHLPAHAHRYLPRVGAALRSGGYAITDDRTQWDVWVDPQPYLEAFGAVFTPPITSARIEAWERVHPPSAANSGYGWRLSIRRKESAGSSQGNSGNTIPNATSASVSQQRGFYQMVLPLTGGLLAALGLVTAALATVPLITAVGIGVALLGTCVAVFGNRLLHRRPTRVPPAQGPPQTSAADDLSTHRNWLSHEQYLLPADRFGGHDVNLLDLLTEGARGSGGEEPLLSLIGSITYAVTPEGAIDWDAVTDIDMRVHVPAHAAVDRRQFGQRLLDQLDAAGLRVRRQDGVDSPGAILDAAGRAYRLSVTFVDEAQLVPADPYEAGQELSMYRPQDIFFGQMTRLHERLRAAGAERVIAQAVAFYESTLEKILFRWSRGGPGDQQKALKQLAQLAYMRGWTEGQQRCLAAWKALAQHDDESRFRTTYQATVEHLLIATPADRRQLMTDLRTHLQALPQHGLPQQPPDATRPSLLRGERGLASKPGAPTPGPGLEVLSTGSLLLIASAAIGSALGFWWGVVVALISGSLWLAVSMIARSAAREEAQRNAYHATRPAHGPPPSAKAITEPSPISPVSHTNLTAAVRASAAGFGLADQDLQLTEGVWLDWPVDQQQLHRVVWELLMNALDEGGQIRVTLLAPVDGQVQLRISNSGAVAEGLLRRRAQAVAAQGHLVRIGEEIVNLSPEASPDVHLKYGRVPPEEQQPILAEEVNRFSLQTLVTIRGLSRGKAGSGMLGPSSGKGMGVGFVKDIVHNQLHGTFDIMSTGEGAAGTTTVSVTLPVTRAPSSNPEHGLNRTVFITTGAAVTAVGLATTFAVPVVGFALILLGVGIALLGDRLLHRWLARAHTAQGPPWWSRFIPRFEDKQQLIQEIEHLGSTTRTVTGWRLASVEYLQDARDILRRLPDEQLKYVTALRFVPWYRSLSFWALAVAGHVSSRSPGKANVVLLPYRAAFRWVFTHELGHVLIEQQPEIASALAEQSWRRVDARNLTTADRFRLLAEVILPVLWVGINLYVPLAARLGGAQWATAYVVLLLAQGVLISMISGGMWARFAGRSAEILDITKPWSIITPYALANRAEEAADLFAAYVLFPAAFKAKTNLQGKYAILRDQLFKGREFDQVPVAGQQLPRGMRRFSFPVFVLASLTVHGWLFAFLGASGVADFMWLTVRPTQWVVMVVLSILLTMRPLAGLYLHLPARNIPEPIKRTIRLLVSSIAGMLYEVIRLSIIPLLALSLMAPSPIEQPIREMIEASVPQVLQPVTAPEPPPIVIKLAQPQEDTPPSPAGETEHREPEPPRQSDSSAAGTIVGSWVPTVISQSWEPIYQYRHSTEDGSIDYASGKLEFSSGEIFGIPRETLGAYPHAYSGRQHLNFTASHQRLNSVSLDLDAADDGWIQIRLEVKVASPSGALHIQLQDSHRLVHVGWQRVEVALPALLVDNSVRFLVVPREADIEVWMGAQQGNPQPLRVKIDQVNVGLEMLARRLQETLTLPWNDTAILFDFSDELSLGLMGLRAMSDTELERYTHASSGLIFTESGAVPVLHAPAHVDSPIEMNSVGELVLKIEESEAGRIRVSWLGSQGPFSLGIHNVPAVAPGQPAHFLHIPVPSYQSPEVAEGVDVEFGEYNGENPDALLNPRTLRLKIGEVRLIPRAEATTGQASPAFLDSEGGFNLLEVMLGVFGAGLTIAFAGPTFGLDVGLALALGGALLGYGLAQALARWLARTHPAQGPPRALAQPRLFSLGAAAMINDIVPSERYEPAWLSSVDRGLILFLAGIFIVGIAGLLIRFFWGNRKAQGAHEATLEELAVAHLDPSRKHAVLVAQGRQALREALDRFSAFLNEREVLGRALLAFKTDVSLLQKSTLPSKQSARFSQITSALHAGRLLQRSYRSLQQQCQAIERSFLALPSWLQGPANTQVQELRRIRNMLDEERHRLAEALGVLERLRKRPQTPRGSPFLPLLFIGSMTVVALLHRATSGLANSTMPGGMGGSIDLLGWAGALGIAIRLIDRVTQQPAPLQILQAAQLTPEEAHRVVVRLQAWPPVREEFRDLHGEAMDVLQRCVTGQADAMYAQSTYVALGSDGEVEGLLLLHPFFEDIVLVEVRGGRQQQTRYQQLGGALLGAGLRALLARPPVMLGPRQFTLHAVHPVMLSRLQAVFPELIVQANGDVVLTAEQIPSILARMPSSSQAPGYPERGLNQMVLPLTGGLFAVPGFVTAALATAPSAIALGLSLGIAGIFIAVFGNRLLQRRLTRAPPAHGPPTISRPWTQLVMPLSFAVMLGTLGGALQPQQPTTPPISSQTARASSGPRSSPTPSTSVLSPATPAVLPPGRDAVASRLARVPALHDSNPVRPSRRRLKEAKAVAKRLVEWLPYAQETRQIALAYISVDILRSLIQMTDRLVVSGALRPVWLEAAQRLQGDKLRVLQALDARLKAHRAAAASDKDQSMHIDAEFLGVLRDVQARRATEDKPLLARAAKKGLSTKARDFTIGMAVLAHEVLAPYLAQGSAWAEEWASELFGAFAGAGVDRDFIMLAAQELQVLRHSETEEVPDIPSVIGALSDFGPLVEPFLPPPASVMLPEDWQQLVAFRATVTSVKISGLPKEGEAGIATAEVWRQFDRHFVTEPAQIGLRSILSEAQNRAFLDFVRTKALRQLVAQRRAAAGPLTQLPFTTKDILAPLLVRWGSGVASFTPDGRLVSLSVTSTGTLSEIAARWEASWDPAQGLNRLEVTIGLAGTMVSFLLAWPAYGVGMALLLALGSALLGYGLAQVLAHWLTRAHPAQGPNPAESQAPPAKGLPAPNEVTPAVAVTKPAAADRRFDPTVPDETGLAGLLRQHFEPGQEVSFADLGSGPVGEFGLNLKRWLPMLGLTVSADSISIDIDLDAIERRDIVFADVEDPSSLQEVRLVPESRDLVFLNNILGLRLMQPALRLLKPGGLLFVTFAQMDIEEQGEEFVERARQALLGFAEADPDASYTIEIVARPADYPASNARTEPHYASADRMLVAAKHPRPDSADFNSQQLAHFYPRRLSLGEDRHVWSRLSQAQLDGWVGQSRPQELEIKDTDAGPGLQRSRHSYSETTTPLRVVERIFRVAVVQEIRQRLHPGEPAAVLDVGCGEGRLLDDLAEAFSEQERSQVQLIGVSNTFFPAWGQRAKQISWIVENVNVPDALTPYFQGEGAPFKKVPVKLIISTRTFEFLDDRYGRLAELATLMDDDGLILIDQADLDQGRLSAIGLEVVHDHPSDQAVLPYVDGILLRRQSK